METALLPHFKGCYPFGLKHHGYNADHQVYEAANGQVELVPVVHWEDDPYHYQYNGKEFQEELGLDWCDYGTRNYDPALTRWTTVDPLAEKYPGWSPYNYTLQNPVKYVDPTGMKGEDWYEEIGSGNKVWYDGSRERAGYEKLPNGTNVIDGQTYQLQDGGAFVNLDTGRQYRKGDKITGSSGFSITSHGAAATYVENMREGVSDTWNSPLARAVVPDKISVSLSQSITAIVGGNTDLSFNWITRGQDASLKPYTTFSVGGQIGAGIEGSAFVGFGSGNYVTSDMRNLMPGQAANALLGWDAKVSASIGGGLGVDLSTGFDSNGINWINRNVNIGVSVGTKAAGGVDNTFPVGGF